MRGHRPPRLGAAAAFTLVSLIACSQARENRQESAYDRVLRTGAIRTAYISYPPSFLKDPATGQFSGIFHDILHEIGRRLGVRIAYVEEVAWGTMIEAIQSGRVDLVSTGLWPTAARGKHADFSDPFYFSAVRAYVRTGDRRFDGRLEQINRRDVTISTIDGEMTSIIAAADYPNARISSLPQTADVSQVLLEVTTRKADVTFVEPAVAGEFIARNPGSLRAVDNVPAVRMFPNVLMVGKGQTELLSTLNIALNELVTSGFVDRIISRYERHPGSFARRSLPYTP